MSQRPAPVLVAIERPAWCPQLDLAIEEASRARAGLRIVHRCADPARAARARRRLATVLRRAAARHPGGPVEAGVVLGPASALRRGAADAGLVVLGQDTRRRAPHRIVADLVAHVPGPVLVGRAAAAPAPARVIVALAGAGDHEPAVRAAFRAAERRHQPLLALFAGPAGAGPDGEPRRLVERWAERYPAVPVELVVRRSVDAAVVVSAATHTAGLVVVRAERDHWAGSLGQALVVRAACPVLLVGDPAPARPGAASTAPTASSASSAASSAA
ncbi:hypothetical protein [Spirilliplanes yamanashiensis]|uniref:UspA domain-containing protein n=1 Tax=Spirilliplanes yamanashiensis TaxID=42233 RepID=A0A8J4DMP4_9ACTN|nr:hypothetical protein [Spirilliplanes yamanashiensis]MDP9818255.1 hypothetical protein [Spirilliplanes yamanashiensis]GIJ06673.1 hypothetical protein Sya03_60250 [Spirilliplanes yamanashiensis]